MVQSSTELPLPEVHFGAFRKYRLKKTPKRTKNFSISSMFRQSVILIGGYKLCASAWPFVPGFFVYNGYDNDLERRNWSLVRSKKKKGRKKINSQCTCFKAVGICLTKDGCILNALIIDPTIPCGRI